MKRKILGMILTVVLAISVMPLPAAAWTTDKLQWLGIEGDYFYNYDFREVLNYEPNKVDWPVTAIYRGSSNANIAYLKSILWGDASQDSTMYMYLGDSGYYYHDSDKGSKLSGWGEWPNGYHVRLYAASGYQSYCPSWGYYVLGTTHRDYWPAGVGWSESACYPITSRIAETVGWGNVWQDYMPLANYESYRMVGFLEWAECDGYADYIYIP